ncbi:MAG TPA: hypothetical protein VGT08_20510 [Terracidiphilus sp.]|nr:hypothetical protein [Terracidiphilus sp.]
MRFYTELECESWLAGFERQKPDKVPELRVEQICYPPTPGRIEYYAHWIATTLTYRMPTLLWMTEWGIWGANWHLYYRFRQSYGDHRLLHEAPGHLFLEYESEDLASFLQLAMLNGWGGYVLTQANYVNAFFSHDEYIRFFASEDGNLKEIQEALAEK